jgi:hypothetical protein
MGRCTWQQISAWKNFKRADKREAKKYKDVRMGQHPTMRNRKTKPSIGIYQMKKPE